MMYLTTTKNNKASAVTTIVVYYWVIMMMMMTMMMMSFQPLSSCNNKVMAIMIDDDHYTFEQYVHDFHKQYDSEQEYEMRQELFQQHLQEIIQHNNNNNNNNNNDRTSYRMEVNEWTDRKIPEELPLGLVKKTKTTATTTTTTTTTTTGGSVSVVDDPLRMELFTKKSSKVDEFYQHWLNNQVVPVSELPKEIDWRTHTKPTKITTDVKQQGFCGSCWAFAATAVLESHIALRTGTLYNLSPQELVSCVTNPYHCGGNGGCSGAIYELAFDYIVERGMVTETTFPYKSGRGRKVQCTLNNSNNNNNNNNTSTTIKDNSNNDMSLRGATTTTTTMNLIDNNDEYIDGAVATIDGYINFPTNNYTILMNAVATLGPIGVTVAATKWSFYMGGIFSSNPNHNTTATTDVNHAVVLEGYGIDQETQELYWLVRNSWGKLWGEGGYIRLKRVDPSTLDDFDKEDCGVDRTPADGAACTKDKDGNDVIPKPMKVCGNSAILYDTFVPIGGKLISSSNMNAGKDSSQLLKVD